MRQKKKEHIELLSPEQVEEQRLKKSVGIIHTSGNLTLVQRKLANVLLYAAYEDLQRKRTHTIPVSMMCTMLGWTESNRVDYLKAALVALQQTVVQFNLRKDSEEDWESMAMISYARIRDGVCSWRYDEALAEKLSNPKVFAIINIQVQRRFDSAYALNLYENCIRYKDTNTGSTGWWTLSFFREIVGASTSYYDDFRKLNSKVIKPSMEKINEVSDIVVSVEFEKKLRSVVGIRFHVREKTKEEMNSIQTTLPGMTVSEAIDEYKEVRESEAFKSLMKHGIKERLAMAWIQDMGEEKVIELVKYTEERDAKKLIDKSTSAYMAGLVKKGVNLEESAYEKEKKKKIKTVKKEEKKDTLEEMKKLFEKEKTNLARAALTLDERLAYAKEWFTTEDGKEKEDDFNGETGRFKSPINRIKFENIFLARKLKPEFSSMDFEAWMKNKNRENGVKLQQSV